MMDEEKRTLWEDAQQVANKRTKKLAILILSAIAAVTIAAGLTVIYGAVMGAVILALITATALGITFKQYNNVEAEFEYRKAKLVQEIEQQENT